MTTLTLDDQLFLIGNLRDAVHLITNNHPNPAARPFLAQLVDQAERSLQPPPVQYQWTGPKVFHIDGVEVHAKGRGLSLAWFAFVSAQTGVAVPHLGHVYNGEAKPGKCAIQALQRAADDVELVHQRLANAMRCIGTRDGHLVLRSKRPNVVCTSPWMVELARRVTSA